MSKILSFRGLLEDGGQDTINLETIRGTTGYKIKKFQLMPNEPGTDTLEAIMKVYSIKQTVVNATIDFSDQTLLAAGYYQDSNAIDRDSSTIVFDNVIFNQDVYVTYKEKSTTAEPCNYYIELESMELNADETTVATLKNIRNTQ